jgi:hypothetical protein
MAGSAKRVPLVDRAKVAGAARGIGRVDGATRGAGEVDMAARGAGGVDRAACGTDRVDGAARGAGRRVSGGVETTCGRHGVVGAVQEGGEAAQGAGNGARRGAWEGWVL